jgi:hypothetical protein
MHALEYRRRPSRDFALHPGINFSRMDVGGDIGGLAFAAGSVIAVLIGLPWLAPIYLASVICGAGVAVLLFEWHRHHPGR